MIDKPCTTFRDKAQVNFPDPPRPGTRHTHPCQFLVFSCSQCDHQRRYGVAPPSGVSFNLSPLIFCAGCGGLRLHRFLRCGRPRNGCQQERQAEGNT